jgi:hypothetical protein
MFYYADGHDKEGNRLITSYSKKDQAEKYRKDATIQGGTKYLDKETSKLTNEDTGLLVRTLMVRGKDTTQEMSGRFVVHARINGEWDETKFRFSTYAAANQAVKGALIAIYEALVVVEEPE